MALLQVVCVCFVQFSVFDVCQWAWLYGVLCILVRYDIDMLLIKYSDNDTISIFCK